MNELAAKYFHQLLLNSPQGEKARSYLQTRGIDQHSIERFTSAMPQRDGMAWSDTARSVGFNRRCWQKSDWSKRARMAAGSMIAFGIA